MANTLAATLTAAYAALRAIGPPVRMDEDPDPETPEVLVLAPVAETGTSHYGGTSLTARIQVTAYAETLLRALALSTQITAALAPLGLHFLQSRPAPDPDSLGVLSEFTS